MDHRCTSVTLYSPQAQIVLDVLDRDGICFSRREYVQKKYEESAPVFLSAYDWFVKAAEAHIPKPQGAEYPYWAFGSPENVDLSAGGRVLALRVPLGEAVFFSLYDWNRILCLSYMGETEKEEKEGTIVVENTGAYERYQYLPYGVDFSSIQCLDTLYRDLNLQKKFWSNREDEKNTYKICMIDEDSLLKTAGVDWQKQTITDEKVRAYADMEMDYRKFVKKHYLALSKKAKEEVAPYVPQKKDNLVSFIEKIRSSLKNAGKEKGDWDALQYASLGTLAFRAANIPARYVEGYEAVTSDEKDANGNYRADVTGQNAHAWVEIYCDGVGWLPVDVTPGHYDKITVKAKQQKKIEKQQTSISQKVTKKKEKPKQNEAPNKYLSWQQIILWIVICIFAVSFLFAGVLAIRRKAIVYKRRKTLMQADTAANYRFIISYLTTLFAYLKLSEEDLPREIREGMERFWFDGNGEITEKELSQLREYGNEIQNTMWQESSCIKKLVLRFWHCFEFPF